VDAKMNAHTEPPASIVQAWLPKVCLALVSLMVCFLAIRAVSEAAPIEGVVIFNRQSRGHDDHVEFQDSELPPAGGIHHGEFQNCGIYRSPIESGRAVHSLEHGAVWITYNLDLPAADIASLEEKIREQEFLLLSPYPGQSSPVVLTAWGAQLGISSGDDERIDKFIARYLLGPRTPERGASCKGGFGTPVP
jgi:hypothetical protein